MGNFSLIPVNTKKIRLVKGSKIYCQGSDTVQNTSYEVTVQLCHYVSNNTSIPILVLSALSSLCFKRVTFLEKISADGFGEMFNQPLQLLVQRIHHQEQHQQLQGSRQACPLAYLQAFHQHSGTAW